MRHEPDGLAAGAIAESVGCPHNTLSSHFGILARSGLVRGTRDGRSIIYRANVEGMQTLIEFLVTIAVMDIRSFAASGRFARNRLLPAGLQNPRRERIVSDTTPTESC